MNATVVDCSALAAVVFEEDWAAEVVPQLKGRRLIAPALLPFELAQVCSTKMRRRPVQTAVLLNQFVAALSQRKHAATPCNRVMQIIPCFGTNTPAKRRLCAGNHTRED